MTCGDQTEALNKNLQPKGRGSRRTLTIWRASARKKLASSATSTSWCSFKWRVTS